MGLLWQKNCFLEFTFPINLLSINLLMKIDCTFFISPIQYLSSFFLFIPPTLQIPFISLHKQDSIITIMRILVQRVFQSWVKVGGQEISRIGQGLLVLLGVTHEDTFEVADHMVSKILNMRLWEKDGKSWNGSVMDINGELMIVSQFTLYAILKGNKPDFHSSMEAEKAKQMFNYVVEELRKNYVAERVQTGQFQALMEVGSNINGPVTIQYQKLADENKKKGKQASKKGKESKQTKDQKQSKTEVTEEKVEEKVEDKIE